MDTRGGSKKDESLLRRVELSLDSVASVYRVATSNVISYEQKIHAIDGRVFFIIHILFQMFSYYELYQYGELCFQ